MVARSRNSFCHGNPKNRSVHIVKILLAVNKIKPMSFLHGNVTMSYLLIVVDVPNISYCYKRYKHLRDVRIPPR